MEVADALGVPAVDLSPVGARSDVFMRLMVAKLNDASGKALRDPQIKDTFAKQSMETTPGTPEQIARFMAQEIPRWREVVQKAGLKQE